MKIIVCAKIIKGEINPFDATALEMALRLSSDVTLVSMAPPSAEGELRRLTRYGIEVKMISDPAFAGSDTLATSYILSSVIKKMEYDLVLCGRQSIDGDTAQVGSCLSKMLKINVFTNVLDLNIDEKTVFCKTRFGEEKGDLPALLTLERICDLRPQSIFSKEKDIEILDNSKIKADVLKCGLNGSPTKVLKTFESDKGRRKCEFISFDELDNLISELLKKEKKKIRIEKSEKKFKEVWLVGDVGADMAASVADDVVFIERQSPEKIAKMAMEKKPSVILWDGDLWGRKNAPIAAAILETGLCADCTALETDGEKLFMYRPAHGGEIMAKIKCSRYPQMATLKTLSDKSDIIVSGGRGIAEKVDKFLEFAKKYNAEIGASRGIVDMGKMPYKCQIGLTGKSVSPKIYIAVGIWGAVHHTCAIENADTIIAINPDKNARIFEYADYGINSKF